MSEADDASFGADYGAYGDLVTPQAEFAERIIKRLNPRNEQDLYEQAARQSKIGGMLITLMIVTWWLFIHKANDDQSQGISVFFGLNFGQAALAVMVLSLVSAVLTELSRGMGNILHSSLAGGMLILAGLYVAEPLVSSLFVADFLSSGDGLWRTGRLAVLWGGMTYGSNLMVSAKLLTWLIRFMEAEGLDMSGLHEPARQELSTGSDESLSS